MKNPWTFSKELHQSSENRVLRSRLDMYYIESSGVKVAECLQDLCEVSQSQVKLLSKI